MKKDINIWLDKFERYSQIKNAIILSGNTQDIFSNPNYADKYEGVLNVIVDYLKDKGYSQVVVWDRIEGINKSISKNIPRRDLGCQDACQNTNAKEYDIGNDIEESIPTYANKPDEFFSYMLQILKNDTKQIVFVLDYSDYLFGNSNALSENERCNLLKLSKTIMNQKYNEYDDGNQLGNLVVLITKNLGTIPPQFYLKNSDVGLISIPLPTRRERGYFIKNNKSSFFFKPELDDDIVEDNFIDLTDNLTIKDIFQIMKLSKKIKTESCEKIVNLFKYGEKISPWEELSKDKLSILCDTLKKRVKGQDEAVEKVKSVIIRAFTGFAGLQHSAKQKKPKGVLFFVGPTGVGKTELAKSIAEFIFGDENACIRFDMSEFSQEHSDQRLIGAPPGYVGYEEGGQLTNAVKNKPFCVLLFDEIEKAHSRILDKFLQILEDGRLTDGKGETVYFSETIIIFTSNLGASEIKSNEEDIKGKFIAAVKKKFMDIERPELLNRIGDNIVAFNFINDENVFKEIAKVKFNPVIKFVKERYKADLKFENEDAVYQAIAKESGSENGGRGLLNIIETKIVNRLAEYVFLNTDDLEGKNIIIKQVIPNTTRFDFELK